MAGASLRGMLGNRMQAEFAATEDVTRAVAITGVWVPTAALLNYCGAGGYVSDVSQPEKNKIASKSQISRFVPAFQVAHEVPIDQNMGKKQKKLQNLRIHLEHRNFVLEILYQTIPVNVRIPNRNLVFGLRVSETLCIQCCFRIHDSEALNPYSWTILSFAI